MAPLTAPDVLPLLTTAPSSLLRFILVVQFHFSGRSSCKEHILTKISLSIDLAEWVTCLVAW